jgi:hypothetical protein
MLKGTGNRDLARQHGTRHVPVCGRHRDLPRSIAGIPVQAEQSELNETGIVKKLVAWRSLTLRLGPHIFTKLRRSFSWTTLTNLTLGLICH